MGFAEPTAVQNLIPPRPVQPLAARARNTRGALHRAATAATPDSLTTLRVQSYVPETPVYTMTSSARISSANSRPGLERADPDSPPWRESQPTMQYPSVSSVVRSTLGEIAIRQSRGGHSRDRDDH
jgi:hypothetical protein